MSLDPRYLNARQAAGALGVTLATLYAYTSRGQLRSEPVPGRPRERRYPREDVDRLRERKEARKDPAKAVARALRWGPPVLASGITLIDGGRLYYRGQDALKLAAKSTLEETAALLWATEASPGERPFELSGGLSVRQLASVGGRVTDPLARLQMALPLAGANDPAAYDLRPDAVRRTGARILRLLTAVAAGRAARAPVHLALQAAWAPRSAAAGDAMRAALVLCADHELNVSAFAARCAASAGASPYDTVSAALATLKGSRHGGASERVTALLGEAARPRSAPAAVAHFLRRGEKLPGFGHPLYPGGDPRAALLLRLSAAGGNRAAWKLVRALARAAFEAIHELPNLDFGLVALARSYGLPGHAPLVLFALGRTAGWIAHAIEQYGSAELIRPRASYTGPLPENPAGRDA